jgi:hypothetical protein
MAEWRNLLLTLGISSARVERTLLSVAFDVDFAFDLDPDRRRVAIRIRVCLQAYRKADPTVEERLFSAA